jgi:surface antigen
VGKNVLRVTLRRLALIIVVWVLATVVTHDSARAETGGYPYADYSGPGSNAAQSYWTDSNGNPYSPYHYNYRNCTDYVAWKLAAVSGWNPNASMGNASGWAAWAIDHGYVVDTKPAVGAVAWWAAASWNFDAGHVSYVDAVNKDSTGTITTVTVSEYNFNVTGGYGTRTIEKAKPNKYIHFADSTSSGGGTPQPSDPNHDGLADVVVVPFVGTGSGKTEAHALNGSGYTSWLFNVATGEAGKTARNGYHSFADLNGDHVDDLYEISMDPTSTVDVHVKAGPNFTTSIGDWATPIRGQSPYTAKVALADANHDGKVDLYVFTLRPGNMVDVHILDGRNFTASLGDFATPASVTTMNDYEIVVNDYNRDGTMDMYLVSLKGNGTRADVHVLDGRGFQNWFGHWQTPFGACDVTHVRVFSGDKNGDSQPDLYFAVYNNGVGKIDVLVLDGHSFSSWVGMWQTIAGASSFAVADITLAG